MRKCDVPRCMYAKYEWVAMLKLFIYRYLDTVSELMVRFMLLFGVDLLDEDEPNSLAMRSSRHAEPEMAGRADAVVRSRHELRGEPWV